MIACLRLLLILGGLGLCGVDGMANPATAPKVKTAQQLAAASRAQASEALADSLMPPATRGPTADSRSGKPAGAAAAAGGEAKLTPIPLPSSKQPPAVAYRFTIPGASAVLQARAAGYHFSPAGAVGARDGIHTTASQFQGIITSEIDGVTLRQFRPPPNWAVPSASNKFYMFVEADLKPAPLAAGWKIRGINLKGTNWKWVDGPRSGAPSVSFVIAITAGKFGPVANEVLLEELVLEGPPGETNWRRAFAPKVAAVAK